VIETYPDYYKMFGEREFTWNKIRQLNRNPLLTMNIGADGLKTGNVDESGYGLSGSAVQNGQRLVVVVNGMKTARDRAAESRKLLEWGFRSFEPHLLFEAAKVVGDAEVFGGDRRSLPLVSERPIRVLVRRGDGERLSARIVYQGPLKAPIRKGAEVARIEVTRGDAKALEMPLYASEDVEVGTLRQRAFDGLLEVSTGWVRRALSDVFSGI
jgi:D-alanyl-D-alanine carboxypeptidase (penicillin-binding protein 5/6)